jgi:hypothetical protein
MTARDGVKSGLALGVLAYRGVRRTIFQARLKRFRNLFAEV